MRQQEQKGTNSQHDDDDNFQSIFKLVGGHGPFQWMLLFGVALEVTFFYKTLMLDYPIISVSMKNTRGFEKLRKLQFFRQFSLNSHAYRNAIHVSLIQLQKFPSTAITITHSPTLIP